MEKKIHEAEFEELGELGESSGVKGSSLETSRSLRTFPIPTQPVSETASLDQPARPWSWDLATQMGMISQEERSGQKPLAPKAGMVKVFQARSSSPKPRGQAVQTRTRARVVKKAMRVRHAASSKRLVRSTSRHANPNTGLAVRASRSAPNSSKRTRSTPQPRRVARATKVRSTPKSVRRTRCAKAAPRPVRIRVAR